MFHVVTVENHVRDYGDGWRSLFVCEDCHTVASNATGWIDPAARTSPATAPRDHRLLQLSPSSVQHTLISRWSRVLKSKRVPR
jgi:hypothetical protein